MRKTQVKINKKVYLGFSIPYLSKIQMHGFSCNYIKEKGNNKPKSCYMIWLDLQYISKPKIFVKFFENL